MMRCRLCYTVDIFTPDTMSHDQKETGNVCYYLYAFLLTRFVPFGRDIYPDSTLQYICHQSPNNLTLRHNLYCIRLLACAILTF